MLLYYHGSDAYRLRQSVADFVARTREQSDAPVHVHRISATSDVQRQECERLLKYPSFFKETNIIILADALADSESAATIYDLLEHYQIPATSDTIVCVSQQEPSGRASIASKKLTAYLHKHARESYEFQPLTGTHLTQWIGDECAQRGCDIAPTAVSELVHRIGRDSWALSHEISKICAFSYAPAGGTISLDAVRQLIPATHEHDEWELSNALADKNKRGLVSALFRRLSEGTPEQLVVGSLASGIRTLITVKDLAERSLAPAVIARTAGLHPYVVTKTLRGAAAYAMPTLRRTLSRLALLDRAFKDGRADATDTLFQIVLEL